MAEIRNTFIKGSMNKDLDERLIPDGQYVDALNIDVETTEGQDSGAAKNKLGNTLVADLDVISGEDASTARTIGAIEYEATNKIYWFVACDTFDGIYEYDEETGTTTRVIQSNKATPTTESKLNLRKEYSITGVNYIKGQDDEAYLYWTDDYNPPRRLNIARAKSYSIDDSRIDDDISVILEPPLYAPSIDTYIDTTINDSDNMSEKFLYFSYRYKYVDDQYSAISPFSAVAFSPGDYEYDYGVGNNKSMTNKFNSVRVTVETGNQFVKEIQILVRDTRNINVSIIDSYSKDKLGINDDTSYVITFNNNKIYAALANDQVTRLYDNVPLLAKAQDVVGNRLAYGNYVQFRNIIDCNDKELLIDYRLDIIQNTASEADPKPTWRSDRDYEFGLVYLDEYGRMTTILNGVNPNYNSIYIPAANSASANSIKLTIQNTPPCWATHYRVYVKQSKKSYYNIFPILFYRDGTFRYFLINQSDLNKIKVGEYIVFKTENFGPSNTNKKYKILEIENKAAGFISNAIEGIYFKIKVDNPSELNPELSTDVFWNFQNGTDFNNVQVPVQSAFPFVEIPIYYGDADPNALVRVNQTPTSTVRDRRFTIEVLNSTQYRYTPVYNGQGGWITGTISIGSDIILYDGLTAVCKVKFNSQPIIGDVWKVNVRGFSTTLSQTVYNYFGGTGVTTSSAYESSVGSFADTTGAWSITGGWAAIESNPNEIIYPGDVVEIQIVSDSLNSSAYLLNQSFISGGRYDNIEEWFIEDGAYLNFVNNGQNSSFRSVSFRRGKQRAEQTFNTYVYSSIQQFDSATYPSLISPDDYPMCMIIKGNGIGQDGNPSANGGNRFAVTLKISRNNTILLAETIPVEEDADIYHELFQTYPIEGGYHKVEWRYSDFEFDIISGDTQFRQFDKAIPHYFNVGDSIDVTTTTPGLSGTWTVTAVPDLYTVVTDAPYPGAGPTTPGTIIFTGAADQDQTASQPAVIQINNPAVDNSDFNAWCWGNGLESDRIYDDFNETRKDFSPRVQVPIEDYKQIRNEASICYSGVFQNNSSLNRLNEFNLSLANFKYLDRDLGSIQKLYARDTDLVVFQENKLSTVLYGKNVLFDSVGGGQVVSIPEVLGTQLPMDGEWGISKHPESFAKWAEDIYFADQRRGVVLQMRGQQLLEISTLGMTDYFRDLMKDNPNTQKLGAYDPHNNMYVLTTNDQRSIPCVLSIAPTSLSIPKFGPVGYFMFTITTDVSWTITLVNTGYGTGWVTDYPTSGNGSQDIYATIAQNSTAANRTIEFEVEYCDGLTETFTLTQARGSKGKPVILVLSNKEIR